MVHILVSGLDAIELREMSELCLHLCNREHGPEASIIRIPSGPSVDRRCESRYTPRFMKRRQFIKTLGAMSATSAIPAIPMTAMAEQRASTPPVPAPSKLDIHTHYYPASYFDKIRQTSGQFSFGTDPKGQTIITYNGARFFGVTPPMTDVPKRVEDMDRVGIDVEVVSLSTPNVFFTDERGQPDVAKMVNDAYADLVAKNPRRFKGFASIPMDAPDAALKELHRAIDTLKLNGVILLSNIRGRALTGSALSAVFSGSQSDEGLHLSSSDVAGGVRSL